MVVGCALTARLMLRLEDEEGEKGEEGVAMSSPNTNKAIQPTPINSAAPHLWLTASRWSHGGEA